MTGLALAASHVEVADLSGRLTEAILGGSIAKRDIEATQQEQRKAGCSWRSGTEMLTEAKKSSMGCNFMAGSEVSTMWSLQTVAEISASENL